LPELPEVETIKNELFPYIVGSQFSKVTIYDPKLIEQFSVEELCRRLTGLTVIGLQRRGKYLIFNLSNGEALIIHLRMTGALLLNPETIGKHVRVFFQFSNNNSLAFVDVRRFGVMWLVEDIDNFMNKLGPEPLSDEFKINIFAQRLRGRLSPIKAVLLDQSFIAGIGNMYADEALFNAKIHPARQAGSLSSREVRKLYSAIIEVLQSAIDNKGASVANYKRPGGEPGTAHQYFKVAHRRGQPCPVCGEAIQRLAIRNRGSYYCPKCQTE
jgi:formamidopyrimidine-DNA glycosylase